VVRKAIWALGEIGSEEDIPFLLAKTSPPMLKMLVDESVSKINKRASK
jgi:hypothetical protein